MSSPAVNLAISELAVLALQGTFIASEIKVKQDDDKIDLAKKQIRSSVMELKLMGYDKKKIVELVKEMYEEIS